VKHHCAARIVGVDNVVEAPVDVEILATRMIVAADADDHAAFAVAYEQMMADKRLTLAVFTGLVATLVTVLDIYEADWRDVTNQRLAELLRRDVKSVD
jgi:hypothetical protein